MKFIFPKDVQGWLALNEGKILYELAQKQPKSGCVVELGPYHGKSTICLAQGSKKVNGGPVYTIDWFTGDKCLGKKPDYYEIFLTNIRKYQLEKQVVGIRGETIDVGKKWQKPVRLLFIDAGHFYEDVSGDWKAWKKHLVDGGIVAFHDCNWPGVYRLVSRLLKAGKVKYPRVLLGNGSTGLTWAYKVSPEEKISWLVRYRGLLVFKYLLRSDVWGRFKQSIIERGYESKTDIWYRLFGSLANFRKKLFSSF